MRKFLCLAVVAASWVTVPLASGQTLDPEIQAKILKGFQIAPVPLNMVGRDAALVGYGSYLVNAAGDCNGCHSAGPQTEYSAGKNPYMSQPVRVNPATYLGGGRDFGAFPDPAGPFPHIVSRNLTPDSTGLAAGGMSLSDFTAVLRTGVDKDHLHPTRAGAPDTKCLPAPFNGDLLQIMPWPGYGLMTDKDIQAIYEYISAIPCIEGGPGEPAKRCAAGPATTASAGPKNATALVRQFQLDGSKSTSSNGGTLTYQWTIAAGSLRAAILGDSVPMPIVQFAQGRGAYTFQLTVTDTGGNSATDTVVVNYQGN